MGVFEHFLIIPLFVQNRLSDVMTMMAVFANLLQKKYIMKLLYTGKTKDVCALRGWKLFIEV